MKRRLKRDLGPASAKEEGAASGSDSHQPCREGTVPAKRADALQRGQESLRGQVFRVVDISRVCQMVAIDTRHVAMIQLSKGSPVQARLVCQLIVWDGFGCFGHEGEENLLLCVHVNMLQEGAKT